MSARSELKCLRHPVSVRLASHGGLAGGDPHRPAGPSCHFLTERRVSRLAWTDGSPPAATLTISGSGGVPEAEWGSISMCVTGEGWPPVDSAVW